MLRLVPPRGAARRSRPSLHRLLRGEFAGFHGTMARCDSLPPFRRASLPSLGDTRRCVGGFAPVRPERPTAGQGFVCRSPLPAMSAWRRSGYPKFLENLDCLFAMFIDAGRTADTRPVRCRSVAPGMCTAKAPAKGLSTLPSMAFRLAVYASPRRLPCSTQDSLPVAGQALPDGLLPARFQRKVSEGFVTSHPPPPSLLGAITSTDESNGP